MSGRHRKNHKRKPKHEGVPAATTNDVESRPGVAKQQPEDGLQKSHSQEIVLVSPMKIIRKPDPFDVAVLGLILTFVIAAIYFLQLRAMQNTITTMETQTRLSVRPWVGLDEGLNAITTTALQIDGDGNANLAYTIRAKNYSGAPGTNVWADANLVIADDLNTVYEQQGFACGDAVIGKPDIGLVLFQGKDRTFNSTAAFTKITLKHEKSIIGVWLAGCIGYRDQFNYLCRTRFIWALQDDAGLPVALQSPVKAQTISGHFVPTASGGAIDTCQIPQYK